jgi:hypothetical protein
VGHAPLNQYLYKFKKVDSLRCPACGHPNKTTDHFLLLCPKYEHERWPIISQNWGSLPKLTKILTSPKMLLPLATYIEATGRFQIAPENALVSNAAQLTQTIYARYPHRKIHIDHTQYPHSLQ